MAELAISMVTNQPREFPRSVPDRFSKMQNMSSPQGVGLTYPTRIRDPYEMTILQTPKECRIAGKAENDKPKASKWPLDPAPVVEFKLHDGDSSKSYLHSPFWFCQALLEPVLQPMATATSGLAGCLVSSLHKVKLQDNIEHGLFIFGDLHAHLPGKYRLKFTLYELRSSDALTYVATVATKLSEPFNIHSGKSWPGQAESTPLSRHLCDSGVKLRIRKETSKRKAQAQDWSSNKRAAVTSFSHSSPMGPPPYHRRRLTGEDITPDQVSFAGGLGIKGAMDREQSSYVPSQLRGGNGGVHEYQHSLFRPVRYPSVSGSSYFGQNSLASDLRSVGLYNPTQYAAIPYAAGQAGHGNPPGTYTSKETHHVGEFQYTPDLTAPMPLQSYSAGEASNYTAGTGGYDTSQAYNGLSSAMNQYSLSNSSGVPSPIYRTDSNESYQDGPVERPVLLPEPVEPSGNLPAWNSGLQLAPMDRLSTG